MQKEDIQFLFRYNYWVNDLIFSAAANLTNDQFTASLPQYSWGGVRGTLLHTLSAERRWRLRCQLGDAKEDHMPATKFPALNEMKKYWEIEKDKMLAYLLGLSKDHLNSPVIYRMKSEMEYSHILWQILAHLVNHGTQHRSEVVQILTDYGHSPGDIDMWYFIQQE